jgi:hypothetical protein
MALCVESYSKTKAPLPLSSCPNLVAQDGPLAPQCSLRGQAGHWPCPILHSPCPTVHYLHFLPMPDSPLPVPHISNCLAPAYRGTVVRCNCVRVLRQVWPMVEFHMSGRTGELLCWPWYATFDVLQHKSERTVTPCPALPSTCPIESIAPPTHWPCSIQALKDAKEFPVSRVFGLHIAGSRGWKVQSILLVRRYRL